MNSCRLNSFIKYHWQDFCVMEVTFLYYFRHCHYVFFIHDLYHIGHYIRTTWSYHTLDYLRTCVKCVYLLQRSWKTVLLLVIALSAIQYRPEGKYCVFLTRNGNLMHIHISLQSFSSRNPRNYFSSLSYKYMCIYIKKVELIKPNIILQCSLAWEGSWGLLEGM